MAPGGSISGSCVIFFRESNEMPSDFVPVLRFHPQHSTERGGERHKYVSYVKLFESVQLPSELPTQF